MQSAKTPAFALFSVCVCVCRGVCVLECWGVGWLTYRHIYLPGFYCGSVFPQSSQSSAALRVSPCSGLFYP